MSLLYRLACFCVLLAFCQSAISAAQERPGDMEREPGDMEREQRVTSNPLTNAGRAQKLAKLLERQQEAKRCRNQSSLHTGDVKKKKPGLKSVIIDPFSEEEAKAQKSLTLDLQAYIPDHLKSKSFLLRCLLNLACVGAAIGGARAGAYALDDEWAESFAVVLGIPLVAAALFHEFTPWDHYWDGFWEVGSRSRVVGIFVFFSVVAVSWLYWVEPMVAALASQKTSACLSGEPWTEAWAKGTTAMATLYLAADSAKRASLYVSSIHSQAYQMLEDAEEGVVHSGNWEGSFDVQGFSPQRLGYRIMKSPAYPLVASIAVGGPIWWILRNGYVSAAVECQDVDGVAVYSPAPDTDPVGFASMQGDATNRAYVGAAFAGAILLPVGRDLFLESLKRLYKIGADVRYRRSGWWRNAGALIVSNVMGYVGGNFFYKFMDSVLSLQGRLVGRGDVQPAITNALFVETPGDNPSVVMQVALGSIAQTSAVSPMQGATMQAVLLPFLDSVAAALNPAAPENPISSGINEVLTPSLSALEAGYGFAQGSSRLPSIILGASAWLVFESMAYPGIRKLFRFLARKQKKRTAFGDIQKAKRALSLMSDREAQLMLEALNLQWARDNKVVVDGHPITSVKVPAPVRGDGEGAGAVRGKPKKERKNEGTRQVVSRGSLPAGVLEMPWVKSRQHSKGSRADRRAAVRARRESNGSQWK